MKPEEQNRRVASSIVRLRFSIPFLVLGLVLEISSQISKLGSGIRISIFFR